MLEIQDGYMEWIAAQRRARSAEVDFGVWWRLRPDDRVTWRVSWIEATGELYAREQAPGSDRYVVLGYFATRDEVEAFMDGWAEGPHILTAWFGVHA